jgi:holo-[acyl-carrier protein] synthase
MIRGIGVDVADIRRIRAAGDIPGLLAQVLTPREVERVTRRGVDVKHAALLFAAKEAFVKALGYGASEGWRWREIEVSDDLRIAVSGRMAEITAELSVSAIRLSTSSFNDHAVALVLLDGTNED